MFKVIKKTISGFCEHTNLTTLKSDGIILGIKVQYSRLLKSLVFIRKKDEIIYKAALTGKGALSYKYAHKYVKDMSELSAVFFPIDERLEKLINLIEPAIIKTFPKDHDHLICYPSDNNSFMKIRAEISLFIKCFN